MILIREVQEAAGDTTLLKNIEKRQAIRNSKTEVQIIVDNQVRRGELQDALDGTGIPAAVVLASAPEGSVEVALDEPQLLSADLGVGDECSVVGYEGLEFAPEGGALDPVYHETSVGGSGGDGAGGVDVGDVVADVLEALDKVLVGVAS